MHGRDEPLDPDEHALLRRAVLEHVRSERRRVYAPLLHVGAPGEAHEVFAAADPPDHALATDLLAALIHRAGRYCPDPLVWLTRNRELVHEDLDARWLAAALAATREAGQPLRMVVVTRQGWRDPRSGAMRTWVRLRAR